MGGCAKLKNYLNNFLKKSKMKFFRVNGLVTCLLCMGVVLTGCVEKKDTDNKDAQSSSTPSATPAAASALALRTTVMAQGSVVTAQNGIYVVPDAAMVTIQCEMDCTFSLQEKGVQVSQARTESKQWKGVVHFAGQDSKLIVTASANGQAPVVMVLQAAKTQAAAMGKGTWSLDNLQWQRGKSLQQVFPPTGVAGSVPWFALTMESNNVGPGGCSQATPCSIVGISLEGTIDPGDYPADPNWATNPTEAFNGIHVNVKVFSGLGRMAQADYRPLSGVIRVTKDGAGTYHYSTVAPITMQRMSQSSGGMTHLPEKMVFSMDDGH